MTRRENFIKYFDEITSGLTVPEDVAAYVDAIRSDKDEAKAQFSEKGAMILQYMQTLGEGLFKCKDIAEGLFISSKTVSGAMRKLVSDGYIEKTGKDPVVYNITEKGKNVKFDQTEGE